MKYITLKTLFKQILTNSKERKVINVVSFLLQITHSCEPIVGLRKALADKTREPWKLTTKGCSCEISTKEPLKGNFHNPASRFSEKIPSLFCQESMNGRVQLLCIRHAFYVIRYFRNDFDADLQSH